MKSSNKHVGQEDLLLVGRVTSAHGIRGGLKVHSYAEAASLYRIGERIMLALPGGAVTTMTLEWVKPHGRTLLMGFESLNDRNQAECLAGSSLFVEKSRLPVLEEGTYYWSDLVGITVYDPAGSELGRLEGVIPTPGNDVYVVVGNIDGRPRETLIPAIGDVILSIDIACKTMVVELPEGL